MSYLTLRRREDDYIETQRRCRTQRLGGNGEGTRVSHPRLVQVVMLMMMSQVVMMMSQVVMMLPQVRHLRTLWGASIAQKSSHAHTLLPPEGSTCVAPMARITPLFLCVK